MGRNLNFGIIGFGFMGQTHAQTIEELPYGNLVGVCDINSEQFKFATDNVLTYEKAEDLLSNSEIDTVIISTPNLLHLEMVEMAAKAGKDIICEKPIALKSSEVEKMIEVVKSENVRFTVHHQRRWDKDYRIAKKVFDSQTLGDMYTVKSQLYGFNGNMHDWHIYPEQGGGMLYDWGVHLIDQILYMIPSKIKSVYADVRNVINENVDDYFNIQLYFENGVNAQIELGTYFLNDKDGWFERHWFIGGNKGSANIDGFAPKGSIVRTSELLENVPGKITMTAAGPTRSFGPPPEGRILSEDLPDVDVNPKMFFDNFYKHAVNEEEIVVKPEEMLRLMRLLEAIRESAEKHKTIDFE